MSKLKINKSKFSNSPIITDSFNNVPNNNVKKKRSFWYNPYVISLGTGLVLFLISIPFQMSKIEITDSKFNKSPLIVDSPNAKVDLSETTYIDSNFPKIQINNGYLKCEEKTSGTKRYKLGVFFDYEIIPQIIGKKFTFQGITAIISDNEENYVTQEVANIYNKYDEYEGNFLETTNASFTFETDEECRINELKFTKLQLMLKISNQKIPSNIFVLRK